ncbi:NeuD/PglB/VioB family sugar acetyltransferase [Aquimarina sp. W85]|uniref:NeuD/PglB/VioB family sugar acetyltransferase n=1 Tax=Aquimarina rhodophyticola TaxID=3342246 RepID=UPI00367275C9
MDKIIVIGASGHAKVIVDSIELQNNYQIHGFIDSYKPKGENVLDYEILGAEEKIPELVALGITKGVIAIGDNYTRYIMAQKIRKLSPSFEFITVIHPSARISNYSKIGCGTVILTSANINADSVIGDFCILNTNSNLGHDGVMKDFSSIAPSATIGGTVTIGEFTAVSIGATIIQNLVIGDHAVIGAGALVTRDVDDYSVCYGVPAKKIKVREKGEAYLKSTPQISFSVRHVRGENDLMGYKKLLQDLNNSNPFYKVELLDTSNMHKHPLCYFVLEENSTPLIAMPFYARSIDTQLGDDFKDVISPYGYSGPLFNSDLITNQHIKQFWKHVDTWYRENNIISEFIRFSLNDNHLHYSGTLIPSLKNVRGKIIDKDAQWKEHKSKVRNNYRKALQEELKLVVYDDLITENIIKDFYRIYIQTMHRNNAHDLYFHPIDYFEEFIQNNPESVIIAMVYKDGEPISTELILKDDDTLYSYLGGTLSEYFYTRPNDFLKIEIITWARGQKFKYYVLGGGREDDDGLYKYKKYFFPNDEDVVYYTGRKIVNEELYNAIVREKLEANEIHPENFNKKVYFPQYRIKE